MRVAFIFEGSLAFGEFEALALAGKAALAEAGKGVEEADVIGAVCLEALLQGREIEGGQQIGNLQGGDLLGGLVDFAVFVFLNETQEEAGPGEGVSTPVGGLPRWRTRKCVVQVPNRSSLVCSEAS